MEDGEEQLFSRPYQSQLEEVAVAKNTIIHLPTGSGKTFIAVRLINRLRETLKKPWGAGGQRTFFLVNTVPLVMQQRKVIEQWSAVNGVAGYSGEDGVDYWDKSRWDAELAKHQVIVMTSQILADMLTHGYVRVEDINLLVFDECHHAVVDHPMRMVMKHFENCPADRHPRVLGLTATLLNANVSAGRVRGTLRDLETTFHATIATVNQMGEVQHYSTNPHEMIMSYRVEPPTAAAARAIRMLADLQELVLRVALPRAAAHDVPLEVGQVDISSDPNKIVKEVKNMAVSMVMFIEELGAFGGALGVLCYVILLERLRRKAATAQEEMLYKFARTHCLAARMVLLDAMRRDSGYDQIVRHSSPKVRLLLDILHEYNPDALRRPGASRRVNVSGAPLSAIIFTRQRFTAKVLHNLVAAARAASPERLGFLEHDFLVGFNINPMKTTREQHYLKKSSEAALLKFCNKELNCLIATSVIEEGVDVPQCSLVLRFDPPIEYRSYIQSKGRARRADASYVMLVEEPALDRFRNLYGTFQDTERCIHAMLVGKTQERDAPTREDIQEGLYDEDEIPPYVTEHGARLSAVSAISLLNRYCSVLPHDQFTSIAPMWVQELVDHPTRGQLRKVKIYMPIACPVKEPIEGQPMASLKGAKRAAALRACVRLHEAGELDAVTLLPRRYGVVDFDQADVRACLPNWPWDEEGEEGEGREGREEGEGQGRGEGVDPPRPGTKRNVRRHRRVFPSWVSGAGRAPAGPFHLHALRLRAEFPRPEEPRERACYDLLRRPEGYGLLTPHRLPDICDFPMFLTAGEVAVSLEVNRAVVELDEPLFELVKRFHLFVFDQVLEVAKRFAVFSARHEYWLFAVPLAPSPASPAGAHDALDIDWPLLRAHASPAARLPPVAPPATEERRALRVRPEEYLHRVVTPWYRCSLLPDRYIVTRVVEHLTPNSRLAPAAGARAREEDEAETRGTFADYYATKYNLDVLGPRDQPLLEVRNISSRMNCLVPRAASVRAFSDKQRRLVALAHGEDKPAGFPEYFVPEFCIKYQYPGHMWYKAVMLPSIVHRVTMLLTALELRGELARHMGADRPLAPPGAAWLPVQADMRAAAAAMLAQVEEPPQPPGAVDRMNNPAEGEAARPVIVSMKESTYQYQRKKISRAYPWDEEKEPLDIERQVLAVTMMDLECYDEFVSAPMPPERTQRAQPERAQPAQKPALMPPPPGARPPYYNDKIELLSAGGREPGGARVELRDVWAALTTSGAHDTCDLERVETLGDAFLKFTGSLYLFHKFPHLNEGQLTGIKSRLIGNRNLYYAGANKQLGGRMKVEQFSPRKDFLVPGFFAPQRVQDFIAENNLRPTFLIGMEFSESEALSGRLGEGSEAMLRERERGGAGAGAGAAGAEREPPGGAQPALQCYLGAQAVSDKAVADCVEALVGTYLVGGGVPAGLRALEWLRVLPPADRVADMLRARPPTATAQGLATDQEIGRLLNHCREDVERVLGYTFRDPSYLLEALSHPSYIRNRLTRPYERLEFLGDALLDFLLTAHAFERYPDLRPGQLTDLRSALVNNVTFASYVVKLGLHKYICYQLNPVLESAIMTFIEHQEQRGHEIVEDVLYLISEEECHIAEYVEVPKVLSDIFESLVGAMYLDSGGRLADVWAAVYRIMHREIDAFARATPIQPVRVLHERIHACPSFGAAVCAGPEGRRVMVPVTFSRAGRRDTVYGCGANTFQAKRAAAKLALKMLAQ